MSKRDELVKVRAKAESAYQDARAAFNEACLASNKARLAWDETYLTYNKARLAWDETYLTWLAADNALEDHDKALEATK